MKLYLVMIVGGGCDPEHLNRCLLSIVPYVEGVCILESKHQITGVVAGVAKRVCAEYDAPLIHEVWEDPHAHPTKFWISDFSVARNKALELLPDDATHWCWIDADTVLENGSLWRSELLIWVSGQVDGQPERVVQRVRYDYDFDGGHCTRRATADMFVKRGCASWVGPLHEQLQLSVAGVGMFDATARPYYLRHLKEKAGSLESTQRNFWIMQGCRERSGGEMSASMLVNEANATLGIGQFERAAEMMESALLRRDELAPESYYQTLLKLGAVNIELGNLERALDVYGMAAVAEPRRGTTWAYMAAVYNRLGRHEDAMASAQRALDSEGADEGGSFSPAFLAFQPLSAIGMALEGLGDVKAALGAYLKLQEAMGAPADLPQVTRLKKAMADRELYQSFGRVVQATGSEALWAKAPQRLRIFPEPARSALHDSPNPPERRVDIWCGTAIKTWGPSDLDTGLGGSEEAVVFLSRQLTSLGYDVTIFALPQVEDIGIDDYGVCWVPHNAWEADRESIFIQWRGSHMLSKATKAVQRYIWLHDKVYLDRLPDSDLALADGIFCLSGFHAAGFDGTEWRKKVILTTNGLDENYLVSGMERRQNSFAYYSSPDRGLDKLLEVWPDIRHALVDATLDIYYGFTHVYDEMSKTRPHLRALRGKIEGQLHDLAFQGVKMHGMVGQAALARSMATTAFWLYPTAWPETSCITAMKAQAMGCLPITSRFPESGVPETCKYDLGPPPRSGSIYEDFEWLSAWRDRVIEVAEMPEGDLPFTRKEMMDWARQTFSWKRVAEQWSEVFHSTSQSSARSRSAAVAEGVAVS